MPRTAVQRQGVLGEREHGWPDADRAVDRATLRFGSAAVQPASLIDRETRHGEGSGERRSGQSGAGAHHPVG